RHTSSGLILALACAQIVSPHISVELMGMREVFGQHPHMMTSQPRPGYHRRLPSKSDIWVAQALTLCRASDLAEVQRLSSPWQDASLAKTRAASRPARAHSHHRRPAPSCETWRACRFCFLSARSIGMIEFIPLSFWYDAPPTSRYSDRRHDPWLVYSLPSY